MRKLKYDVAHDGYINRFVTTGVFTRPEKFKKAVLHGRVNEWLKKGFSIHENPCRREFVGKREHSIPEYMDACALIPGEEAELWGQKQRISLYFPFGNVGYDDSGFYYCPACLRTYCGVTLMAAAEDAEFEIETCGGMTVWNNGSLITDFIPFTRNMVKRTKIRIPLCSGENRLVICLEDLAERDTDYYFRIRYMGKQILKMILPVPDTAKADDVRRYEAILEHIFFEKDSYISEPVMLELPPHLIHGDTLLCLVSPGEIVEKMQDYESLQNVRQYNLGENQRRVELFPAEDCLPGYYFFLFGFRSGPVSISRKIGCQIVWNSFLAEGPEDTALRKKILLSTLARYGVDNVYKAAAFLKIGIGQEKAENIIAAEIKGVNARQDCSDFHFTVILYIYMKFGNTLSSEIRRMIREAAAGYRYWIDEPGDDVMWFFSENHALLFHLCQYMAGTLFPDISFTNSGRKGIEVRKKGEELLDEWFANFFSEFITEWNSSAYIPVDVLGLATLFNITDERDRFHAMAKKALDMISFSLAVNSHNGAVMTSFGRSYEKELKGNYNAGTTSLLYVLYNAGFLTRDATGSLALALGDYEAPEEYRKYIWLKNGEALIFQNTQGFEKHVNLYLYKTNAVLLSTAVLFRPFGKGYQEHICQATIDETAQVFVNHPGELHPYGSGRPNYWAGNGVLPLAVQYRNMAVLVYRIPEDSPVDYTHAYVPLSEFQEYTGEDGAVVLRKGRGCIGIRALGGLEMIKCGPCTYREFVSRGRENVWVIKVKDVCEGEDIELFLQEMERITIYNCENTVTVIDGGTEFSVNSDLTFRVNGRNVYEYPLDSGGRIVWESEEKIGYS